MFIRSESKKKREMRVREIMKRLDAHYGDRPMIFLEAKNAWQLLFATILSAQCTDARVNMVTEKLFVKYKDLQAFADCDLKELEEDIHSTGFYHNKAKNMKACAKALVEEYGGEVPQNIEALTALPGVGRKTGNLILGNIYHIPSIVVDTHVKRISNRLGLADSPDPTKVEFQLMEHLPEEFWIRWNTHIIALGRTLCTSQSPKCGECYLQDLCPSSKKDPETWRPVGERKRQEEKLPLYRKVWRISPCVNVNYAEIWLLTMKRKITSAWPNLMKMKLPRCGRRVAVLTAPTGKAMKMNTRP